MLYSKKNEENQWYLLFCLVPWINLGTNFINRVLQWCDAYIAKTPHSGLHCPKKTFRLNCWLLSWSILGSAPVCDGIDYRGSFLRQTFEHHLLINDKINNLIDMMLRFSDTKTRFPSENSRFWKIQIFRERSRRDLGLHYFAWRWRVFYWGWKDIIPSTRS